MALKFTDTIYQRRKEIQSDRLGITTVLETFVKNDSVDAKESSDAAIQFLCSCVVASPFMDHKVAMLDVLESVDSSEKLAVLHPLVESSLMDKASSTNDSVGYLLSRLVKIFCLPSARGLLEAEKKFFKTFIRLLQEDSFGIDPLAMVSL